MKLTVGIHSGSSTFTLGKVSESGASGISASSQYGCLPFMVSECLKGLRC